MRRWLILNFFLPFTVKAQSDTYFPEADNIAQQVSKIQSQRQQIFDTTHLPRSNFPNIPTPSCSGSNIEETAAAQPHAVVEQDHLLIFASFSMPQGSLKRLIDDAAKVNATIVMRGFKDNSFKKTISAMHALKLAGGNVVINPHAFTTYQIEVVPTIVLLKRPVAVNASIDPNDFAAVSGDVTLFYALNTIVNQLPSFKEAAGYYLPKLVSRHT